MNYIADEYAAVVKEETEEFIEINFRTIDLGILLVEALVLVLILIRTSPNSSV